MAQRGRTQGAGPAAQRPRPVVTGRALMLAALLVLLVVVVASPIKRYLGSRSDVSSAAAQLQHDRAQQRSLSAAQQRYGDPGYIEQQARDTLQYAMPGDTVYVVVGQGRSSDLTTSSGHQTSKAATGTSWNTRLWASVRAAGQ